MSRVVQFFNSRKQRGVMAHWANQTGPIEPAKVAFAERRGPQPKAGESWVVEKAGENPAQTVIFLRLVRRIDNPEEAERERVRLDAEAGRRSGEVILRGFAAATSQSLLHQDSHSGPVQADGYGITVKKTAFRHGRRYPIEVDAYSFQEIVPGEKSHGKNQFFENLDDAIRQAEWMAYIATEDMFHVYVVRMVHIYVVDEKLLRVPRCEATPRPMVDTSQYSYGVSKKEVTYDEAKRLYHERNA